MQCYTPLIRIYQKTDRATREEIKASGYKLDQKIIPRERVLRLLKHDENYLTGIKRINKENEIRGEPWRYQAIPCRHCYACSLNYAAEKATRIMCEVQKDPEHAYFITLTYDDEHLPIPERVYYGKDENAFFENDGTWIEGTLVKEDLIKFRDRLRKHLDYRGKLYSFKWFGCGEYGETNGRPHYHMILMSCHLDTNQFYGAHKDPHKTYETWKSHELDKLWPFGYVDIATCNWQDAAYTARYTAKKWLKTTDDWEYYMRGKIPEFITQSKGIGDDYFLENMDKIYETDSMIAQTVKSKTSIVKPGKRCDQLLEKKDPEKYDKIKEQREKISEMLDSMIRKNSNYTDLERLRIQEEKITTKAKMLKREI